MLSEGTDFDNLADIMRAVLQLKAPLDEVLELLKKEGNYSPEEEGALSWPQKRQDTKLPAAAKRAAAASKIQLDKIAISVKEFNEGAAAMGRDIVKGADEGRSMALDHPAPIDYEERAVEPDEERTPDPVTEAEENPESLEIPDDMSTLDATNAAIKSIIFEYKNFIEYLEEMARLPADKRYNFYKNCLIHIKKIDLNIDAALEVLERFSERLGKEFTISV